MCGGGVPPRTCDGKERIERGAGETDTHTYPEGWVAGKGESVQKELERG